MVFLDDPQAALQAMFNQAFAVVVADVRMPKMSGIAMIEQMRSTAPDTRYLLLTGSTELSVAVDAINRVRIFRFLMKPCSSEVLLEAITSALNEKQEVSLGEVALDRINVGVIVCDLGAKVLFTNRMGGKLLKGADALLLGHDGICRAASTRLNGDLHQLIRSAAENGDGGVMSLDRGDERRPLSLVVCPTQGKATVYINDPEETIVTPPVQLKKLLGLTLAEARLAYALAAGSSLEEAAATCAVAISTARSYLKTIFLKTSTSRQSDLVRLILSQPAMLR